MSSHRLRNYGTVLPTITLVVVLSVYPMVTLLVMSFSEVSFSFEGVEYTYVGLGNFIKLSQDEHFVNSIRITFIFVTVSVIAQILLGMGLAMVVSQVKHQWFFRTSLLMTMMLPPVTVALVWRMILNPDFGIANAALMTLGFSRVDWLHDPDMALVSIIMVDTWHWTAFSFLVILAGITALPVVPFEAAKIDGASRVQTFRYITLPLLRSTILIALLFRVMDILQAFPEIWLLTWGGPAFATTILNIFIYLASVAWMDWGYAAAVGLIVLLVNVVFAYLNLKARRTF